MHAQGRHRVAYARRFPLSLYRVLILIDERLVS